MGSLPGSRNSPVPHRDQSQDRVTTRTVAIAGRVRFRAWTLPLHTCLWAVLDFEHYSGPAVGNFPSSLRTVLFKEGCLLAMDDPLSFAMEIYTFVVIIVSAVVFARLALKAKSIGSFRFQLSAFILIWAIAEVFYVGGDLGFVSVGNYATLGLAFHFASMAAFAVFVGARTFKFLHVKPAEPPKPVKPIPLTGALEK